jgi:ribosome-binding protein aMBF1 (putative translation factor)
MNIGAAIRRARVGAGYSQDDLAYLIQGERFYISRVENGHCVPKIEQVMRIATALGIETWQLVRDAECTVHAEITTDAFNQEQPVP